MADRAYGWDETIENPREDEFTLLPDGDYPFEVIKVERGRHDKANSKVPPCFKATIHLRVDGGQHGVTTVQRMMFLHTKFEWLISQFYTAIGLRKHGEPLVMQWDRVMGAQGRVRLDTRKYKNEAGEDRETNNVVRFLDPTSTAAPPPQKATEPPEQQALPADDDEEDPIPF